MAKAFKTIRAPDPLIHWLLVVMFLAISAISYSVGTFWWTVVGTIAAMAAAIAAFFAWRVEYKERQARLVREAEEQERQRVRNESPFDIYLEPHMGETQRHCDLNASNEIQRLQVTLKANIRLSVARIRLAFSGNGIRPQIDGLYDWNRGLDMASTRTEAPFLTAQGSWYWDFGLMPLPRPKGRTVKIGLRVRANEFFDGALEVQPELEDQEEDKPPIKIPVRVRLPGTDKTGSQRAANA